MPDRPIKKPRWATVPTVNGESGQNNVIEPIESQKDLGWDFKQKPARNHMNWIQNLSYQWIDYLDSIDYFATTEQSTPAMAIDVFDGQYNLDANTFIQQSSQSIGSIPAPSSDPRIDRIYLNKVDGVATRVAGSEAASPTAPAYPADSIPLAQILLYVGMTEIVSADITDERSMWDIVRPASDTVAGVVEKATQSECNALSDTDRFVTPGCIPLATTAQLGVAERANQAEANALSDQTRFITPEIIPIASETQQGLAERATQVEANQLGDISRFIVPGTIPIASATQQGLSERAIQTEVDTGTDVSRFVTSETLQGKLDASTVTGYDNKGQVSHFYTGDTSLVNFDIDAVIGNAFEDVGPTGSGATNIWTALDALPANTIAVQLVITNLLNGSTNGDTYQSLLYGRITGSTLASTAAALISRSSFVNRSGSNEASDNITSFWMPVDSNARFDLRLQEVGTSPTADVTVSLRGFSEQI